MKILLSPDYFYPEIFSSSYIFDDRNKAFTEAGYDIICNVPYPTRGVNKDIRREYAKRSPEYMYNGKMKVVRFPLYGEGKNPLLRALRYVLASCIQFFQGLQSDFDIIFMGSTPPFQGAMGGFLKSFKHRPLVFAVQDIFPDSVVGIGMAKKGGILWKIGSAISNYAYRKADKIIVISQDFKKNLMAKGVPEDKIEVIYNWVDHNAVVDIPREQNKLFDTYNLDREKFYITYNGNIGLSQNMDMLLEVMKELKESHPDIELVLVGDGAYKKQVENIVKRNSLTNVSMLPFQPYEDISHVFSLGDASLVISKPGTGAASVPSKTWSIMSASRPVLANFDENELKNIIENNECGIFTKAGDKEAFKKSLFNLYNNRELCKKYGENGRKFVMENLTREIGTQKYVDLIKSLM